MTQHVNSRDAYKNSISKLLKNVRNFKDDVTEEEVDTTISILNDKWVRFERFHLAVIEVTGKAELELQIELGSQVEDLYLTTMVMLNTYKRQFEQSTDNQSADKPNCTPASDSYSGIHLPKINLPTFCGEYTKWMQFRNLFESLIDKNGKLSQSQKLQYLKSSVSGEAAQLLNCYDIMDANYKVVWKQLIDRFENKRMLTTTLLQNIVDIPKLNCESAMEMRKLVDTVIANLNQLGSLSYPTEQWDVLITFLISRKLDNETLRQWELFISSKSYPTWSDLTTFIYNRSRSLESISSRHASISKPHTISHSRPKFVRKSPVSHHAMPQPTLQQCWVCKKSKHRIFQCSIFLSWPVSKRQALVAEQTRCLNCLQVNHDSNSCPSSFRCLVCKQKHHTLLHPPVEESSTNLESTVQNNSSLSAHTVNKVQLNVPTSIVLLPTAMIKIKNSFNEYVEARVLLDQGSQCSFVTEALCQSLRLPKKRTSMSISGIGVINSNIVNGIANITFKSTKNNQDAQYNISALVVNRITQNQPITSVNTQELSSFVHLELADTTYNTPSRIDILLGADVYGQLLTGDLMTVPQSKIVAQNTYLGWILSGPTTIINPTNNSSTYSHHACVDLSPIDKTLRQFWELESIPNITLPLSLEDQQCEQHFASTHSRNQDGRYIVQLPFKDDRPHLGKSKQFAIVRLQQIERKLRFDSTLREQYTSFMTEYEQLHHMSEISETTTTDLNSYFIPHHHVLKNSTTTKLRVVFDASSSTSSGISLNDALLVGPKLQRELMTILLCWRSYRIAFCADIEKMYRQILIAPSDHRYQQIVWRQSTQDPIKMYQLQTVTYGTSSAPYLANKVLQQLATDEGNRFPLAKNVIFNEFYVDDVMSGSDDVNHSLLIQQQLIDLLKCGGFHLRKWSSNSPLLLQHIPNDDRESKSSLGIDSDDTINTLGLNWCPSTDTFHFKTNAFPPIEKPTKRSILSNGSKLFDPLGFLTPTTITIKILFQDLWQLGLDWDDVLPDNITQMWAKLWSSLGIIEQIQIPRWINTTSAHSFELHGFCDASEKAFSAVIYTRNYSDGVYKTQLVMSKSKVAPIKTVTIPRLELCAALLLSRLLQYVQPSLHTKPTRVTAWTDSSIVLSWLRSSPNKWKCFVANRTSEILDTMNSSQWKHVSSIHNPADCASRGISPSELKNHKLWWAGPPWLQIEEQYWPSAGSTVSETTLEAKTNSSVCATVCINDVELVNRYSSLEKLVTITSLIRRFILKLQHKSSGNVSYPTASEYQGSLRLLIKVVQHSVFSNEINKLLNDVNIKKGQLSSLNPYLDEHNILRVGGRLQKSMLALGAKHPIILPRSHHFTRLVIEHAHRMTLHGGNQLVHHYLRSKYWIIGSKAAVRKVIHSCLSCFKHKIAGQKQLMGQLPSSRVTPSRPFLNSGVDYTGAFTIKFNNGRGSKTTKAYIAVFVCMSTKAVHLEVVNDLTADAFIASFKRFTARRGRCKNIYSDNGTNFIGANTKLMSSHKRSMNELDPSLAKLLANDGTNWHFIPVSAPHFGGLWEAAVKSLKLHLHRIVKDRLLTFEELTTVTTQVEACLNSRPLCPSSADPNDLDAISPSHFLIGDSLITLPEDDHTNLSIPKRWALVQAMYQTFWKRWSSEYLHQLQQRTKWKNRQPNLFVNQLVIVIMDHLPPAKWILGRIVYVHPGDDGLVRVVTVKTRLGDIKRSVSRICPLPFEDGEQDSSSVEAHFNGGRYVDATSHVA